ncbi:hypothetical protein [Bradyrhizobium genosp. P]|uniref:hypothetical protein n=1 Tax=Bradyrhizobium genosp. P TaxID=83641 RepID=UPI003CF8F8B9
MSAKAKAIESLGKRLHMASPVACAKMVVSRNSILATTWQFEISLKALDDKAQQS